MLNLFKKQKPQQAFTESIALTNSMKALVSATRCPACGQLTLGVVRAEQGTKLSRQKYNVATATFLGYRTAQASNSNRLTVKDAQ